LLVRVGEAARPRDIIDWLLLKDVVALTWEIQRSRRHRETVIRMGRLDALKQILDQVMPKPMGIPAYCRDDEITHLAAERIAGDSKATKRVDELLHGSGFSRADIDVHAMTVMGVELQRIDSQVARNESHRDSLLRQIERRREGWAKDVQRASEEVIEGEFREMPPRVTKPAAG
jgi:hypothetical protein